MRKNSFIVIITLVFVGAVLTRYSLVFLPLFVLAIGLAVLAARDVTQTKHAILRNFPVLGHFRYLFEMIRPEISQYFIETDTSGTPFNREKRSLVYQRAKGEPDTVPFGTQRNVYEAGYEWLNHSMKPSKIHGHAPRVSIGKRHAAKPYDSSILNVSAMSFGSLSDRAILALSRGARAGDFAHNTGEGGVSLYHAQGGADLIYQIGTGYFGCRSKEGGFDQERFKDLIARHRTIKMIELKLSQGAKPGHGGILPAMKVTAEIAEIRGVPMGQDVLSPPAHQAFSTPLELAHFIEELREHSGGLPVGIKFCVGHKQDVVRIVKAFKETELYPDFIAVDGGEGGTGAAPLEFSNTLGTPLTEGLILVQNVLNASGLRKDIKLIASGKVASGFDMARLFAIGADLCYSARSMMMALGCIQARRCNVNDCPTGIATQKRNLVEGLVVSDKVPRVERYHRETIESLMALVAAAGLSDPWELEPLHLFRRVSQADVRSYDTLYEFSPFDSVRKGCASKELMSLWAETKTNSFV